MQYTRILLPGATYFFTFNLANRKSNLLIHHIDDLRFAFKRVQRRHSFFLDAISILPDHIHMIMTLPANDTNYSKRIKLIKAAFSWQIKADEEISKSRQIKRERGIWQRRFWEHAIRDAIDYEHHINYIHYNPVKHGYVKNPADWPYSSIHRFIRNGDLSPQWGCLDEFTKTGFGE